MHLPFVREDRQHTCPLTVREVTVPVAGVTVNVAAGAGRTFTVSVLGVDTTSFRATVHEMTSAHRSWDKTGDNAVSGQ